MSNKNEQGFTLIEVILVVAITGALLMVAFIGQGQLRAQAQFDASINKVISTIADAHNQATAGVNLTGAGNGRTDCGSAGSSSSDYVFGGVAWVADPNGSYRMDFYKVVPQAAMAKYGCIFSTSNISVPAPIKVSPNGTGNDGAKELFIRSNDVLNICPIADPNADVEPYFLAGNCTEGNLTLDITDDQGRHGQVVVDKRGLAVRKF